ncbi:hypothetical protein SOV_47280 [Sporomusa ovata DSM 2662]|uniref:DUF1638 domain-containing protein n=1 Tax=Sporomusa ovata TaxID=2378 RepID=A0A0U1KV13_9FIRM|nr:DUF1638 domain-containing protein [Sporomusa ovata]EQB27110.1 hypothetical protein DUF1638 [Sporomusa ovata DSM 2662]CQR71211.1 hypothetical protein SpAn4DRAFT_2189 [Sporomusa ovata]
MLTVILACQTMKDELNLAMQQSGINYPVVYLESGLHNSPENLREKVQEQVDTLDADIILLVFGCCGKGLVGIKSTKAQLVIPRIDDCITFLLGSTENRRSIPNEISTYFITKGWLDPDGNVMWSYQSWVERYGERKALRLTQKMLAHYTRFMIIDTGAYDIEGIMPKIKDACEKFNMHYDITPGSLRLLHILLTGPWGPEFIILNPGQETVASDFYPSLVT